MRFRRLNKSKLIKRDRLRVAIRYFKDGGMETHVEAFETGKWKTVSMAFCVQTPSWDDLHGFHYVSKGDKCREAPAPINALVAHLKYTAHCMSIKPRRGAR